MAERPTDDSTSHLIESGLELEPEGHHKPLEVLVGDERKQSVIEDISSKRQHGLQKMDSYEELHSTMPLQRTTLPPGKCRHASFIYDRTYREWVNTTVEKLEQKHGFVCREYDADDVSFYWDLFDVIEKSYKIFVVLRWKDHRKISSLLKHSVPISSNVVPILLSDFVILKHMHVSNYVDARDFVRRDIWWSKLLMELETEGDDKSSQGLVSYEGRPPLIEETSTQKEHRIQKMDPDEVLHSLVSDRTLPEKCQIPFHTRPLPPGKNCHASFLYYSSNREWVKITVKKLEKDYGFVCREYDVEDFKYIQETVILPFFMHNSYKIFLVSSHEEDPVDVCFRILRNACDSKCTVRIFLKDFNVLEYRRGVYHGGAGDYIRRDVWWPKLLKELESEGNQQFLEGVVSDEGKHVIEVSSTETDHGVEDKGQSIVLSETPSSGWISDDIVIGKRDPVTSSEATAEMSREDRKNKEDKCQSIVETETPSTSEILDDSEDGSKDVDPEKKLRSILSSEHDRKEEIVDILFQNFNSGTFEQFLSKSKSDIVLEHVLSHILKTKHREALCMTLGKIQEDWRKRLDDSKLVLWIGSNYIHSDGELTLVCFHINDISSIDYVSNYLGLPVLYRHFQKINPEPLEIMIHQKYQHMSLTKTDAECINQLIRNHTEELFNKHSNLEAISASSVISSKTRGLVEETAIVFYCRLKGVIPFGEYIFPRELKTEDRVFVTDVREGFFSFGMFALPDRQSPTDMLDPLRIGCSIGKYGLKMAGTLGPFVELPEGKKGILTCSHVFGVTSITNERPIYAVQPADGETGTRNRDDTRCGLLLDVVFETEGETGIDAALVEIDLGSRGIDPTEFVWRHSMELLRAGFSEEHPPSFQNGRVEELNFTAAVQSRVIKFGRSSGLTKGSIALNGPAIRIHDADLNLPNGMILNNQSRHIMKGQFLVEGTGNEPFFTGGDSGSAVYLVNSENELTLIGLAIGSLTQCSCVVTPIGEVLRALHLNPDSVISGAPMEVDA